MAKSVSYAVHPRPISSLRPEGPLEDIGFSG